MFAARRDRFPLTAPTSPSHPTFPPKGCPLRTEQEISQSWSGLFSGQELNDRVFDEAEGLIDALRPESPLRHRLDAELAELRQKVG